MKTWKITVNEDELKALINYHNLNMMNGENFNVEISQRIHDLTKRLNRDNGEVDLSNDPRPIEDTTKTHLNKDGGW